MRRFLPLAALVASACNPNFEFGTAKEKPPEWAAPPMAGGDGGGHGDASGTGGGAGSLEQIEKTLKEKVAADPKDLDSRKQLGQLYAETGKWDDAVKVLDEAIVLAPKDVETRLTKVAVLLQRKDQGAAKLELEKATALAPNEEGVLRAWRQYWLAAEDTAKAVEAGKKLLAKHPDIQDAENIELWNFYLSKIPKLGDKEQLKKFFDLITIASRAQDQGDHATAIARYGEARAMLPDDPHLLASLALSQWETGAKAEAMATWNEALRLDPANTKARLGLSRAQADGGDPKGAVSTLQAWVKRDARRAKRHDAEAIIARLEKGEPYEGAATAKSIAGTVDLAPSVAAKVPAGAIVYVMAKQQLSDRIPLAVFRAPAGAFPMKFTLDESNVMQQGMPFDGEFVLLARIDGDGNAGAQPGDLEGATPRAVKVGSRDVKVVVDSIVGGGGGSGAMTAAPAPTPIAGAKGAITGSISIDPQLASKVPAGATLYIMAKMSATDRIPIAVVRDSVGAFPMKFTMDQSNVMQQGMPFDGEVFLIARIDQDGMAGAAPGDMEGMTPAAIKVGSAGVEIRIDKVR